MSVVSNEEIVETRLRIASLDHDIIQCIHDCVVRCGSVRGEYCEVTQVNDIDHLIMVIMSLCGWLPHQTHDVQLSLSSLFTERMMCIHTIADYKKANNLAIRDENQYRIVRDKRLSIATCPDEQELMGAIFDHVHEWSCGIQESLVFSH